ncbi:hypothetical protein EDC04DRAFT_2613405 [Pisolithus marmoratus]|nr:hypothetical protein EDC04DRAFT_2613405 [Pisolithus marmoratus]
MTLCVPPPVSHLPWLTGSYSQDLDWSTVVPPVTASPAKSPVPPQQPPPTTPTTSLRSARARAERFGIPLVEPKQPPQRQAKKISQSGPVSDDPEKLKKRAERFGSTTAPTQSV